MRPLAWEHGGHLGLEGQLELKDLASTLAAAQGHAARGPRMYTAWRMQLERALLGAETRLMLQSGGTEGAAVAAIALQGRAG